MKKILLLLAFMVGALTCNAQKAKSFFYDGLELHHVKGWTILPSKSGQQTEIQCIKFPIQLHILKQPAITNTTLENYLHRHIEALLETMMNTSGKAPTVKETSEIMDGFINNIPAKYVDITYTKKVRQRIYAMNIYNATIVITCTGVGGPHDAMIAKSFNKILSSFTFNPESNTQRLF